MRSAFMTVQIGYSIKIIYAHVAYKCNQNLPATSCRPLSLGHLGQISHKQSIHFPIIYWWLCGDGTGRAGLPLATSSAINLLALSGLSCSSRLGLQQQELWQCLLSRRSKEEHGVLLGLLLLLQCLAPCKIFAFSLLIYYCHCHV